MTAFSVAFFICSIPVLAPSYSCLLLNASGTETPIWPRASIWEHEGEQGHYANALNAEKKGEAQLMHQEKKKAQVRS